MVFNKIGFVGLGAMGMGMATNLMTKSGAEIIGYAPSEKTRNAFSERGGSSVSSLEDIYKDCELIFLCLPTNQAVKETVEQIVDFGKEEAIIVDMSSTAPHIIRELYKYAMENGKRLLDSPVSGGKAGADEGTLAIMCGGDENVFEIVKPYLLMMGKSAIYMGESGCGSTAKLANNIIVGGHLVAMGEAYTFAKKAGLAADKLFEATHGGFAQSAVVDAKMPRIIERNFQPTARVAVHYKDIKNALEVAENLDIQLPLTQMVKDEMAWLDDHGMINDDHCSIIRYYEDLYDVEV